MKLKEILTRIAYLEFIGNEDVDILNVTVFNEFNTDSAILMWVNKANLHRANELKYGTLIFEKSDQLLLSPDCNYIIVDKPRAVFNQILNFLFPKTNVSGISAFSNCDSSSVIAASAYVGHFVVIEKNCEIGENTVIGHNTVLKEGTKIGNNVLIGSNNVIGGIGFGYEKDNDGLYTQMNHIGNVVIEDGVEIGNNTCIDRAVMGSTLLKKNCKIDNLVHIAHGVVIGENSLVIAHAMIAGSTVVGRDVWVAPGALVLNKVSIADGVTIGMGAVVLKSATVEADVLVGNPAKSIKKS